MPEPRRRTRTRKDKPKHLRNKKQEKPRRFNYNIDDPLCLNFRDVSEFLGEPPLCRKTATKWDTFDKIFDLYWGSDNPNIKRRSGWNQKYRQGYQKILDMLIEIDDRDLSESLIHRFKQKLRTSFEYHCPCAPATSPTKWIAPNGGSHDRATWLAFRPDGSQEGYATSPDEDPEADNSWTRFRRSIKWDRMFGLSARDVVMLETIEQLTAQRRIARFRSYDGNRRDLISYQDDESARSAAAEVRNAKEDRRRRIERKEIEFRERCLSYNQAMKAKQLEEEKRMIEENREWTERCIRIKQHAREREKREDRVRRQDNYRVIKQHYTPVDISQRKYPNGRPSKHPHNDEDDDNDPLNYHNLRKAVKRGRWETKL